MKNLLLIFFGIFINYSLNAQCSVGVHSDQFNIKLFSGKGILQISGLDCDLCKLGYKGASICKCLNKCDEIIDDCKDSDYWEYCKAVWEYEVSIGDTYAPLEKECCPDFGLCQQTCGEPPVNIRTPTLYGVVVNIWYNTGFVEDFSDPANVVFNSQIFQGDTPSHINLDLNHAFPNEQISNCYNIITTIVYDDCSRCIFDDSGCVLLG